MRKFSCEHIGGVVWLGGVVVRALDLRLEIAGSIPAAALSSATLDKLFTHIQSFAWVKSLFSVMTLYVKICILRRFVS